MLFRRRNRDLDDEIAAHLAMARRDGVDPAAFGNAALIKEVTREKWGWTWLDALLQDLRYALRMLRRTPGFTAVAVLSLALGIGANTAIFSLIDALMLRRLPVRQPEQLVELLTHSGASRWNAFSWPAYLHLRDTNTVFSGLLASPTDNLYTRADGREPERLEAQFVSGNCFDILGIRPAIGRLIATADDQVGSPAPVAVVSWSYWQSRFHGDPGILGAHLTVEDAAVTIVGVLPPEFGGLQIGRHEDLTLPLAMAPVIRSRVRFGDYGAKWIRLVGRLKPGVSIPQARAEMNVLFQPTLDAEARLNAGRRRPTWTIDVDPASAGLSRLRDQFSKPLLILMTVVGLLLLIACANVAGLLLARASSREREMAVRVSLGAGRSRILRQILTESLLLSALAGIAGVALAYFGTSALVAIMQSGRMPLELEIRPDLRVLAFTAAVALLTGALFGLAPALRAAGAAPAPALRESLRGTETRRRRIFGRFLVVSQVAISMVMLAAAGLFVQKLAGLQRIDLGFRRDHVLLVALDAARSGYTPEALARGYQQLLTRIETIPGVRAASLSWIAPVSGGGTMLSPASVDGHTFRPGESRTVYVNWIAPRYFETLGTPLVAGRDFGFAEPAHTAIVNQAMARHFFGDANPLGRHFSFDGKGGFEIVGVAGDAKYMEMQEAAPPTAYLHAFDQRNNASQFLIRTAVDPAAVAPDIRRAVREDLKTVRVGRILTLEQHVDASIVSERLIAILSGLFGALGALLAAIGLYGLLAYTVARRTQEIGIRMALGAARGDVLRMVLRDAMAIVLGGLALGVPGALAARRLAAAWTTGVPPFEPAILFLGAAVMLGIALLAAWLPARRAARVQPIDALR